MKTKKFLIISSIVVLFIFVNLSVSLQINQAGQKTDLISLIKSALADTEDPPYYCTTCGGDPCWLVLSEEFCRNHVDKYFVCVYTCELSSCGASEQTTCP